jgi:hypothetical protein
VAVTLYACSLINFRLVIATYNVLHHREARPPLDLGYLAFLGPQAIPAIDRLIAEAPPCTPRLIRDRAALARVHLARTRDWRSWGFRDWRLTRYLEATAAVAPATAGAAALPAPHPGDRH